MTTTEENNNEGSFVIPMAKAESTGPSREVPEQDAVASCTGEAGQENTTIIQDAGNLRPVPGLTRPKIVRAPITTEPQRWRSRQKILEKLPVSNDPEIADMQLERSVRNLVCSVLERHEMMNEELLLRIAGLQDRIDELEEIVEGINVGRSS